MKKTVITIAALIAGTMATPFNAVAVVPQPQRTVEEFIEIYQNSEEEYDFNLDGVVDMKCYTERAVDKHPKIW